MAREDLRPRDWLSFALAAVLPGLVLAIALSGIVQYAGDPMARDKSQATMWLVSPLWMATAGIAFGFRTPSRAWRWLLAADAVAIAGVCALRLLN